MAVVVSDGEVMVFGVGEGERLGSDREAFANEAQTRERFAARRIDAAFLEAAYDVDRPEDLERLRRDLAGRDPAGRDYPRATARVLRALGPPGAF